jgi:hypothetical protein
MERWPDVEGKSVKEVSEIDAVKSIQDAKVMRRCMSLCELRWGRLIRRGPLPLRLEPKEINEGKKWLAAQRNGENLRRNSLETLPEGFDHALECFPMYYEPDTRRCCCVVLNDLVVVEISWGIRKRSAFGDSSGSNTQYCRKVCGFLSWNFERGWGYDQETSYHQVEACKSLLLWSCVGWLQQCAGGKRSGCGTPPCPNRYVGTIADLT